MIKPLAIAFALLIAAPAAHAQINQPRVKSAKQSVKVLKAKQQQRLQKKEGSLLGDPCSQDLNAGNVIVPEGARAPREVVIVIEGDVTNVAPVLGNARCRR